MYGLGDTSGDILCFVVTGRGRPLVLFLLIKESSNLNMA